MVGEGGDEGLEALKREQRRLFDEMTALEEDYEVGTIDQKTYSGLSASHWEALTDIQRRINATKPLRTRTERIEEYGGKVRTGYLVGGGLTAAIFFGLFYWAINYTYTERVWHPLPYIGGYWTTETLTLDPAIQALFLVVAIIGLVAMVYGALSRK
jgi:hypothetical protein